VLKAPKIILSTNLNKLTNKADICLFHLISETLHTESIEHCVHNPLLLLITFVPDAEVMFTSTHAFCCTDLLIPFNGQLWILAFKYEKFTVPEQNSCGFQNLSTRQRHKVFQCRNIFVYEEKTLVPVFTN
jgi:hypothetical protein